VILIYSVLLYKNWKTYPNVTDITEGSLVIKAILVVGLIAGNYLGGKLIYHYKIAINDNN
jgi:hypothetical protein